MATEKGGIWKEEVGMSTETFIGGSDEINSGSQEVGGSDQIEGWLD